MIILQTVIFLSLFSTVFPLTGQSRIPADSANYIQFTGSVAAGDVDDYMVAFFSVPDTTVNQIYFGINHPYLDGALPDSNTGGTWNYYLVGGSGTISDPNSRKNVFASQAEALTGNTLETLPFIGDGTGGGESNSWNYFAPVSPASGEHIGNQYYFKIVAEAPAASTGKNAFQLDVSATGGLGSAPQQVGGVRSFAYAWTLALLNRGGKTWDLHPFVPDNAVGNIESHFVDFDDEDKGYIYNRTDRVNPVSPQFPNLAQAVDGEDVFFPYSVAGQTNGTWLIQLTETGTDPFVNTSFIYATGTNPAEGYRVYASDYAPAAADHVLVFEEDGSAETYVPAVIDPAELERVYFQVADIDGNSVPYSRTLFVTVSGSARIRYSNNFPGADQDTTTLAVTTSGDGLGYVEITNTVAEQVIVSVESDGSGGLSTTDDRLPSTGTLGTNETGSIIFQAVGDSAPTLVSSDATTVAEGATVPIGEPGTPGGTTIAITEDATANITATNDIYVTIPTTIGAIFNNAITSPGLVVTDALAGPVTGAVDSVVTYPDSRTMRIDVTTGFGPNDVLTIGGTTPLELIGVNASPASVLNSNSLHNKAPNQFFSWLCLFFREFSFPQPSKRIVWDSHFAQLNNPLSLVPVLSNCKSSHLELHLM